jgi:hypothetical protein
MTRRRKREPIPKPPWCGSCDEHTRQTGCPPRRCPLCHPLAASPEARDCRATHQAAP